MGDQNGIIVITKVAIVIVFIVLGWSYMNPVNHANYIPAPSSFTDSQGVAHNYGGIMGILGAAGVVFFAFIGFDAVSTAAQEAKNPKKDMPIGILGSLAICTVLSTHEPAIAPPASLSRADIAKQMEDYFGFSSPAFDYEPDHHTRRVADVRKQREAVAHLALSEFQSLMANAAALLVEAAGRSTPCWPPGESA